MKIVKENQPKIVIFTAVKNRCMLHGRVFVMCWFGHSMYIEFIFVFKNLLIKRTKYTSSKSEKRPAVPLTAPETI